MLRARAARKRGCRSQRPWKWLRQGSCAFKVGRFCPSRHRRRTPRVKSKTRIMAKRRRRRPAGGQLTHSGRDGQRQAVPEAQARLLRAPTRVGQLHLQRNMGAEVGHQIVRAIQVVAHCQLRCVLFVPCCRMPFVCTACGTATWVPGAAPLCSTSMHASGSVVR